MPLQFTSWFILIKLVCEKRWRLLFYVIFTTFEMKQKENSFLI